MNRLDADLMRGRMRAWLAARMPEAANLAVGPVHFPTEAGRSAESSFIDITYERDGQAMEDHLVVRREHGSGELFLGADLRLPWTMMQAMARHSDVPVPECIGIEMDPDVLTTPFLVMRRRPGRIPSLTPNYNLEGWVKALRPEQRAVLWRNGIEQIARVHSLDWRDGFTFLEERAGDEVGLGQYLVWLEAWYRWAVGDRYFPVGEAALDHLLKHRPAEAGVDVLWGDAMPHNVLFAADLSVSAVLDWEAARLGPGEIDLAWWIFFNELLAEGIEVERLPGLPSRAETVAIYESASGRTCRDLDYYSLLAEFRMTTVGIRAGDRRAGGPGRVTVDDMWQNPSARMAARRLGMGMPEKGPGYAASCVLLGKK
jgi:aminoglycoside phosphotransferase (APT) family kinase protein